MQMKLRHLWLRRMKKCRLGWRMIQNCRRYWRPLRIRRLLLRGGRVKGRFRRRICLWRLRGGLGSMRKILIICRRKRLRRMRSQEWQCFRIVIRCWYPHQIWSPRRLWKARPQQKGGGFHWRRWILKSKLIKLPQVEEKFAIPITSSTTPTHGKSKVWKNSKTSNHSAAAESTSQT